jgi:putative ATP-dependent endonuclease of OLD family
VLIGENDCGTSSLLEALSLVLDPAAGDRPPRLQPHHFHRPIPGAGTAAGPLRIVVGFRERRVAEWQAYADSPLGDLLRPRSTGLREITFELRAWAGAVGCDARIEWCISRSDLTSPLATTDAAALAWLRQASPLVWVRRGRLLGAADAPLAGRARVLPPRMSRLVARIRACQVAVVTGTTPDVQASLSEGFDAARDLIGLAARHLGGPSHNFRQIVADILGAQPAAPATGPAPLSFAGSSAERIGVLAMVAALVDALPDALGVEAEPVWVIEDPEASLHPMTLAAVLRLVGHIKWQKIVTTQSGDVLAAEPLRSLRRLTRDGGVVREWRVRPRGLSAGALRRVGYHLRGRRGMAHFARCWLLVEGETEFWLVPELASILGFDFALEGIVCVEFAQCGLGPLVALARDLGIEWHVLSDGDAAGESYAEQAMRLAPRADRARRVTMLAERDIEHCFHAHGYAGLFTRLAGPGVGDGGPRRVIARAIDRRSKPMLALDLVVEAADRGASGVPPPMARLIATCVALARSGPGRSG